MTHVRTHLAGLAIATALAAAGLLGGAAQATASESTAQFGAEVIKLTNDARATKGCDPLKIDARLTKAAQAHADDMAGQGYFDHTSLDGRTWDQRIRNAGFKRPSGENIASGFDGPGDVVHGWMASPGHRRNILDCSFRHIGVGFAADGGYWVQDFGY